MKSYNNWLNQVSFGNTWIECKPSEFQIGDKIKLIGNKHSRYPKIIGYIIDINLPHVTVQPNYTPQTVHVNLNQYKVSCLEYISNQDYCNYWIDQLFQILINYSYKYKELVDETEIIIDEKEDTYKFNTTLLREKLLKLIYKHSAAL